MSLVVQNKTIQVIIPASGRGSRFQEVGYTLPKPLLSVYGKPMLQKVVENLQFSTKHDKVEYTFLVLKDHYDKYQLDYLLPLICKPHKCQIIVVDKVTEGAACTVLLAEKYLNPDQELVIANSDQLVEWVPKHFIKYMRKKKADGGIATFLATDSKWSFAKVIDDNLVTEVAEKNPISNVASVGIYYYKSASIFITGAKQMIKKNIRVLGEYYVCPVFNEIIGSGGKVYNYPVTEMWGLGTPQNYQEYLQKVADGTAF